MGDNVSPKGVREPKLQDPESKHNRKLERERKKIWELELELLRQQQIGVSELIKLEKKKKTRRALEMSNEERKIELISRKQARVKIDRRRKETDPLRRIESADKENDDSCRIGSLKCIVQ